MSILHRSTVYEILATNYTGSAVKKCSTNSYLKEEGFIWLLVWSDIVHDGREGVGMGGPIESGACGSSMQSLVHIVHVTGLQSVPQ